MSHPEPLGRFSALRTEDPDELKERLSPLYAVRSIEPLKSSEAFSARLNLQQFGKIGLGYARYGAPLRAMMANTDFYAQGFGLAGCGEAVVDGRNFRVADGEGGAGGPGSTAYLSYGAGLSHLFFKIEPSALISKLSSMIGGAVHPPLKLSGVYNEAALAAQYRLLTAIVREIDRHTGSLPVVFAREQEQALIVAFLCSNRSNYTNRLDGACLDVAPRQVRLAEEYIEANWNQPITIEALVLITDSSARSLFASFRKCRGYSPMTFVKRLRLQRSRDQFLRAGHGVTVTAVALECGFNNLGHFAKDYFEAFGELPSATLKRADKGG